MSLIREKQERGLNGVLRVLLVEDNALMQTELTGLLEEVDGMQVVQVEATAQGALRWLEDHPDGWDLAVVDMFLAQGHGFDVVKHCSSRASQGRRVVMLSNFNRDSVEDHARAAGADRFFDKSSDLEVLLAYCQDIVRLRSLEQGAAN